MDKTLVVVPNDDGIKMAVDYIKNGKVICFKTDTIYGFSCDATNKRACQRILDIKGRDGKPMILLAKNQDTVKEYSDIVSHNTQKIMTAFWPGALTIIMKSQNKFSLEVTAGRQTIGFRVPNDDLCQQILSKLDFPIVSTSANISGQPSLNSPQEILAIFDGKIDLLIDSGISKNNMPSTIIDASEQQIKVLREGYVSSHSILEIIN